MSETEIHTGTAIAVGFNGKTLEELCKVACEEQNLELGDYYETYEEALLCEGDNSYVVLGGRLWFLKDRDLDGDNIKLIAGKGKNEFEYTLSFYNGGASFGEALEYLYETLEGICNE